MRPFRLVAVVAAVAAVGCAARQPVYDPYRIDRSEFRQRVHTIALMPTALPSDLPDPEAVRQKFENLIADRLHLLGFATLPAEVAGAILKKATVEEGGLYSPTTGEVDEKKEMEVRERLLRALADVHHADAVLHPRIYIVKAAFGNGVAHWLGTSQRIEKGGSVTLRILGGVSVSGTVPATAFSVVIEDMSGNDLYLKASGIEALSTYSVTGALLSRNVSELFLDDERNAGAVHRALDEL